MPTNAPCAACGDAGFEQGRIRSSASVSKIAACSPPTMLWFSTVSTTAVSVCTLGYFNPPSPWGEGPHGYQPPPTIFSYFNPPSPWGEGRR